MRPPGMPTHGSRVRSKQCSWSSQLIRSALGPDIWRGIVKGGLIVKFLKQSLSLILSCCLLLTTAQGAFAQTDQPPAPVPVQAAQQTQEQLQQLVAPIALYPDALVAQILAAATYPDQVVEADRWL